jgi:hypothetical protein
LGTETNRPNELETQECSVVETPRARKTGLLAQPQENSNEDSNQGPGRFYRRRATGSVRPISASRSDQSDAKDDVMRGASFETDYASFLAWRDWGCPDAGVCNVFAAAALRAGARQSGGAISSARA